MFLCCSFSSVARFLCPPKRCTALVKTLRIPGLSQLAKSYRVPVLGFMGACNHSTFLPLLPFPFQQPARSVILNRTFLDLDRIFGTDWGALQALPRMLQHRLIGQVPAALMVLIV